MHKTVYLSALILDPSCGLGSKGGFLPSVLGPNLFRIETSPTEAVQVDVVFSVGSYEEGQYGSPYFESKETRLWRAKIPATERDMGRLA